MKEFKSQVCTSIEQSQRLLDLGLKPETADMYIFDNEVYIGKPNVDDTPTWSLHRLMEIAEMDCFNSVATAYDEVIRVIKFQHGEGYINKEYLKQ